MAIRQGVYDSPLGRERTLRFLKAQDKALTAAEPLTQKLLGQTLEATEVFGPQPAVPQEPAFGLQPPQIAEPQPEIFGPPPTPQIQEPQPLGPRATQSPFGQAQSFLTEPTSALPNAAEAQHLAFQGITPPGFASPPPPPTEPVFNLQPPRQAQTTQELEPALSEPQLLQLGLFQDVGTDLIEALKTSPVGIRDFLSLPAFSQAQILFPDEDVRTATQRLIDTFEQGMRGLNTLDRRALEGKLTQDKAALADITRILESAEAGWITPDEAEQQLVGTLTDLFEGGVTETPFFGSIPVLRRLGGIADIAALLAFPLRGALARGVTGGVRGARVVPEFAIGGEAGGQAERLVTGQETGLGALAGELVGPLVLPAMSRRVASLLKVAPGAQVTQEAVSRLRFRVQQALTGGPVPGLTKELKKLDAELGQMMLGGRGKRAQEPVAGFEPEPVSPPAGRETPLFPELEQRAALERNIEESVSEAATRAETPHVSKADIVGDLLDRRRLAAEADLNLPAEAIPQGTEAGSRFFAAQKDQLARGLEAQFGASPEFSRVTGVSGRDYVGEGLLRKDLPTTRDIQARSKQVPPEVRAQMAASPPDVRVPIDDIADTAKLWGDLFQKNWFTKLDDLIGPLLGKNRPLEKAVRDLFVLRDIYVRTQSNRLVLGFSDWIGRNRQVLGLVTRGGREGFALNIPLRKGAKVDLRLAQRIDDIIAHQGDYIISPAQRKALQEIDDIFTNILRAEQRGGVNIDGIENYWTRVITKVPKGQRDFNQAVKNITSRQIGGKPFYARERAIPDIRAVYAAGYETASPLAAVERRLSAAPAAIADQYVVRNIKAMGYKPTEKVNQQLAAGLKAAKADHIRLRQQALKTGSLVDRAARDEAEKALEVAQTAVREDAKRVQAAAGERRLGRIVPDGVASELDRYIENLSESAIDDFFQVARTVKVNADAGSLYLQNFSTFWRNPIAWQKAAAYGLRTLADDPFDYIVRNLDALERGVRYGAVVTPSEFLLARGGRLSQFVGRLPVIKQSQRIFEWNIFVAQAERWKAVERLAKNEGDLLQLASVLRKNSGSNFMPGLTNRQAWIMGKTWFAPQFVTALQGALLDPLIKTGVARREALKTVGLMFGGAATATVSLNLLVNGELPNMTDPNKPGFWGIKRPGGFVFPFGPYQILIETLARTQNAVEAIARGEKPSTRDVQAWPRMLENKVSIPARFVIRTFEALGVPFDKLRGAPYERPELVGKGESWVDALLRGAGEFAPIGPEQAIRGIRAGFPEAGLEIGGVTTRELTPAQERNAAFLEHFGTEYGETAGARTKALSVPHLAELVRKADERAISRGTEFGLEAKAREEVLVAKEQELGLPETARQFLAGQDTGPAFARDYEEFLGFRAAQFFRDFFGDERDPGNEAQQAYLAWAQLSLTDERFRLPETREIDYEGFTTEKDRLFVALPEDLQAAINTVPRSLDETTQQVEIQYRQAKEIRSRYFDTVPIQGMNSELYGELRDFWAFVKGVRSQLLVDTGQDLSLEEAIRMLGPARGKSESFIATAISLRPGTVLRDRLRNPLRDAILLKNRTLMRRFFPELFTKRLNQLIFGIESGVR